MAALPVSSIPAAMQHAHYSNTNHLKDNFLFISEQDDQGIQHANLMATSQDGSILPNSQAGAHEFRAFKTEKLPQRPETSTGNKQKQMLVLQQNFKTKALMQVYGQPQVVQRKEPHSDLLSSSGKSRSSQARAQSQTNVFSKRDKRGPQIKKQGNQNSKNMLQNNQCEFDQMNQILSNESQELTLMDSPQKKISFNNASNTAYNPKQKVNLQNKRIQDQPNINVKLLQQFCNQNYMIDFSNLLKCVKQEQNSIANETKRTSQPGSSHLINAHEIYPDDQISTPLSIQFKNSKAQNMKKQRNLKNFSAQSAVVDGAVASFQSTQNQYNQLNDLYNYSNQNVNTLGGADTQKNMQFKMSDIKIMQNISIQKQGSMQNVRRNTQSGTNPSAVGINIERGGTRYKSNKQSQIAQGNQQQVITIINPLNLQTIAPNNFQVQAQKIGVSSSVSNNNNKQISIFNSNVNSASGGQKVTNNEINSNQKMNSILSNLANQNVYVAVNSSTGDKRISQISQQSQQHHNQINIQQRRQSLNNKGRQSFKDINLNQVNQRIVNEPLLLVQQYHSSNQHYNNYNVVRNSIQQDNFFTGQNVQEMNQNLKPKSFQMNNFMIVNNIDRQNAQMSSKSSKGPSQSAAGVKYSHQLIQPTSGYQETTKINILQNQQRQMIIQNQKLMNKTPQILPQKVSNGNFSRKLTINSNKITMKGVNDQSEKQGDFGFNPDIFYQHNNASLQQNIQNTISIAKQNLKASEEFRSQKGTLIYCQSPVSMRNNEAHRNSEVIVLQGKSQQASLTKLNSKAAIKNNERYNNNLQDSYDSNLKFIDSNQLTYIQGNKSIKQWILNENSSIEHTDGNKNMSNSIAEHNSTTDQRQKMILKKQKTVNFNNNEDNQKLIVQMVGAKSHENNIINKSYKQNSSNTKYKNPPQQIQIAINQQQLKEKELESIYKQNSKIQSSQVYKQKQKVNNLQLKDKQIQPQNILNTKITSLKQSESDLENQYLQDKSVQKQSITNTSAQRKKKIVKIQRNNQNINQNQTPDTNQSLVLNNGNLKDFIKIIQNQRQMESEKIKLTDSKQNLNDKKQKLLKIDGNDDYNFQEDINLKINPRSPDQEQKSYNVMETKRDIQWNESALTNDLDSQNAIFTNQSEIREYQFLAEEEAIQKSLFNQKQIHVSNGNKKQELLQSKGGDIGKEQTKIIKNQNNFQNNFVLQSDNINNQTSDGKVFTNNNQKSFIQQKVKTDQGINQLKIELKQNEQNELIKIQDNNFNSIKKVRDADNQNDVVIQKEQNDQKIINSKSFENDKQLQYQKSRSQSKNNSLRQSKNNRSGAGLNWAQGNLGNVLKNSQSQKRLNQMRKQMNQNRLKELPNKIHDTDQHVNQKKNQQKTNQIKGTNQSVSADDDELKESVFNQIKKPPQVPSLGSKIQQAQKQQISQLPEGQLFSEEASVGVSGISTVGGVTGNGLQQDQAVATDYHSNNNAYAHSRQYGIYIVKRKNSSILSTANRYYLQINTPSALGYTSVLLGGTSNNIFPQIQTQNLYHNLQYHEDPDVFAEQLLFDSDRMLMDQYRQNEHFKLIVDPLGEASNPFMYLPNEIKLGCDFSINEEDLIINDKHIQEYNTEESKVFDETQSRNLNDLNSKNHLDDQTNLNEFVSR